MFVKTTNGTIDQYPYTVGDLRRDNPNTSFPKNVPLPLMAEYGMFPVSYQEDPEYNPNTQRLQHSTMPELVNGEWVLTKTVVPLTEEQLEGKRSQMAYHVRKRRDKQIADTDWMALSDNTLTPEWATYRQALRDITDHANFPWLNDEDWPVKPS